MSYSGAGILHTLTHISSHSPLSSTLVTIPIFHVRKPKLSKISEEHTVSELGSECTCVWFRRTEFLRWLSCLGHPMSSADVYLIDTIPFSFPLSVCLSLSHIHRHTCAYMPTPQQTASERCLGAPSRCLVSRWNKYLDREFFSARCRVCLSRPLWILRLQAGILSDGSLQDGWTLLTFVPWGSETCWSCYLELIALRGDSLLLDHLQALNHSWSFYFIRDVSYLGWCHSTLNHLSLGVKLSFLTFDG